MMLLIFILGFFIEWIEICYIVVPLFLPIFAAAAPTRCGGPLIGVILQTSFLTPLFGSALFFLEAWPPPRCTTAISTGHLSVRPPAAGRLVLVFYYPGLAPSLPKAIGW